MKQDNFKTPISSLKHSTQQSTWQNFENKALTCKDWSWTTHFSTSKKNLYIRKTRDPRSSRFLRPKFDLVDVDFTTSSVSILRLDFETLLDFQIGMTSN